MSIFVLFNLTQNVSCNFGTIYCGIIAICLPHMAIYRDTLLAYRDSPNVFCMKKIVGFALHLSAKALFSLDR